MQIMTTTMAAAAVEIVVIGTRALFRDKLQQALPEQKARWKSIQPARPALPAEVQQQQQQQRESPADLFLDADSAQAQVRRLNALVASIVQSLTETVELFSAGRISEFYDEWTQLTSDPDILIW